MVAEAGAEYTIDWREQLRRPFKRGFMAYTNGDVPAEKAEEQRSAIGVSIAEDPAGEESTPCPVQSFEELGVAPPWLLEGLRENGLLEPTPLQAQALPIALAGQNLVTIARQSAGQDAASIVLSAVHVEDQPPLTADDAGPIVLVLTQTQELASQFAAQAVPMLKFSKRSAKHSKGLRCVNVSGGGARSEKLKELGKASAHIVVGTAKRICDMASKEQISLLRVTLLILDGVDRVLEDGFAKEVGHLARWVRPERQTVLYAATWPRPAAELAKELCFSGGPPVHISVSAAPSRPAKRQLQPADIGKGGKAKRSATGGKSAAPPVEEEEEEFLGEDEIPQF